MLATMLSVFAVSAFAVKSSADGFIINSEVHSETLTIVGVSVDIAQNRVLLKVVAEATANVDPVANFFNVTVKKGAEVTVNIEHSDSPAGPWTALPDVKGKVIIDRAGADIEVKLDGELPAQGYFRAKIVETAPAEGSVLSDGNVWIIIAVAVVAVAGAAALVIYKKKHRMENIPQS